MSILPIVTYNDSILRQKSEPIPEQTDQINDFIEDMFETMYNSDGVGLAAPQVGSSISIFVIDADAMIEEDDPALGPIAFINPEIIEKKGELIQMDEGCLSIPLVTDKVSRPESILIKYLDQNFNERLEEYDGWVSRIIQHEYDHLQGVLFIDYLSAFRKRMHKSDLKEIELGERETSYPLVPKE